MAYAGFDCGSYPGDSRIRAWAMHATYKWCGYYLLAPCHGSAFTPWSGKYQFLRGLGFGLAVLYVGRQQGGCGSGSLSRAQGQTDGADAIAKCNQEGFPQNVVVFLDVEHFNGGLSANMKDYYQGWVGAILDDGKFKPGTYCADSNANEIFNAAQQEYAAHGLPGGNPAFWIVKNDLTFDPQSSIPGASGVNFANVWQGRIDVEDEEHGGVTISPIDQNVADTIDPSATLQFELLDYESHLAAREKDAMSRGLMTKHKRRERARVDRVGSNHEGVDFGKANDALSHALRDFANVASEGSARWFFPRGIDFLQFSADVKTGHLEIKASGAPQSSGSSTHDILSGLPMNSMTSALRFAAAMEHLPPPSPRFDPSAPTLGDARELVRQPTDKPSLESVAAYWANSCVGKDTYTNNCAHFLSDAFIRAGYAELSASSPCINARCDTPAKRPIRARDMWCWFQSKATKTSTTLTKNTGWWASFQLDESVYWGGHVVLLDSNNWKYYGTGWYPDWDQHLYQW